METYENELQNMNDIEKFEWLLKKKEESDAIYAEIFFRYALLVFFFLGGGGGGGSLSIQNVPTKTNR